MAALTNVRDTSELGGKYIALPVKGATTIYQGAIVAVDANGYAIPGKKAADLKAAGRAEETVENKGGDGDAVIRVSRGTFVFENSTSGKITAADVLGLCYMEDDRPSPRPGRARPWRASSSAWTMKASPWRWASASPPPQPPQSKTEGGQRT